MPTYIAPYRGRDRGLPAGFMEAATMPGRAIGAGIERLGSAVADAVTQVDERHKQEAKLGKAAETFFESIPENERPMDLQAFKNLAAKDKVAKMQGLVEGQGYRKGVQDLLNMSAARRSMEANANAVEGANKTRTFLRNLEVEAAAKKDLFDAALRDRLSMPDGQHGPVAPMSPRELFDLASRHGVNDNPMGNLLQVQQMEGSDVDITPRELNFGGNSYLYTPKPNTLQRNVRPDETALAPKAFRDEAGNVLGHYVIDPESGRPVMLKPVDKPGVADVIRYEEAVRALDKDIADQEQLVQEKSKYARPDYLKQLKDRRARLQMHYERDFGDGSSLGGAADSAPLSGAPASTSAPSPGIRAVWKNGKLVFPK